MSHTITSSVQHINPYDELKAEDLAHLKGCQHCQENYPTTYQWVLDHPHIYGT